MNLLKRLQIPVILILLFHLSAYAQTDNEALKSVVSKLKDFSSAHVSEKAYLHFDKPYYAAGDTIYFKAYLTMGERHQPSGISGVLHVDLINTNSKIDQSIKLQVNGGAAWGDFALPDSLPKGNYRVRAYTQWMRNDGNYFEQTIPIGSMRNNKIPESSTARKQLANTKPDVQFFPEGGQLVAGIPSKVAFKAIGSNGLGLDAKGIVVDNTGNEVSKFSSVHLGMGYFYLTPEAGKTYQAKVSYPDGSDAVINLPQVASAGIVLKINNDSLDKAPIQIIANDKYFAENRDQPIHLLVYTGGIANMVTTRLDSALVKLLILKRHLHSGITKVTLFSSAGEPLSERLIFIQNPDQLKLSVSTDKPVYQKRGKVHLSISVFSRVDSAVAGHFSVSVIDESKVPVDENSENTILNYLLLTSDLKGYIEQPNYYFTNISDKTRADLDLVMLTHGYRRFEWKPLLDKGYPPIAFQPENGLEIGGTATNLFGKPLAKGTVSLIPMHKGHFMSATTDNKGRFSFNNLVFADTGRFILQATNVKGKDNTKLTYDGDKPAPAVTIAPRYANDVNELMGVYLENAEKQQDDITKTKMLENVTIKGIKANTTPLSPDRMVSAAFVQQSVSGQEIEKAGGVRLSDKLLGKFHGRAVNPFTGRVNAGLIVLDGVSMPPGFELDNINPSDVESVDAVYGPEASIFGMRGATGVLVITSKRGRGINPNDIVSIGILPISPKGFYKAREFYAPKYDHPVSDDDRPDLRTTIFWKPNLVTDKDGSASFDFYNADGPASYRIVVEGMDEAGNIGRQVYRYHVE